MNGFKGKNKGQGSAWRYLAVGYLCIILFGSVLLILPFATAEGESTSYLNALFTSASATCVTGLVPYDTATHWSLFGQIVILCLIQLGGVGFMTFVSVLFLMIRRGVGVSERRAMMQTYGGREKIGLKKLIRHILLGTAIAEITGAALLCIRFVPDFGGARGVWYAVWHSVSAFCNAGFDLMGEVSAPFASLTAYARDPLVSLVVSLLIVFGGIGFCVWGDVFECKFRVKKFQLFTKVVLSMTGILLVLSTGLYLLFERANPAYADYTFGEKLLCAFFNAATARTAGFSTTDPALLSESGYLLTVILMFIGASSGSTAGGIKVTTFAVIVMGMFAAFRGRRDINIGKRRIDPSLVGQALAIFAAYLMLALLATLTICTVDGVSFKAVLFETVSALGTVGLSLSLTPLLSAASRVILIMLMYLGRVGVLTFALALRRRHKTSAVRYPVDLLFIG